MTKLDEYIENLKLEIKKLNITNELEVIRYIYLDLGSRLDFDINYTFGNNKQKNDIYNRVINMDELNNLFESGVGICKGISYLFAYILNKFNITCEVIREFDSFTNMPGKHVYNKVILNNGKECTMDIEEDLEYIQTHDETTRFALYNGFPLVSPIELRNWDIKNGYIKEGYYFDDMIDYFKKVFGDNDIDTYTRLKYTFNYLHLYQQDHKLAYREMIMYHKRLVSYFFSLKEQSKIHFINSYMTNDDGSRSYYSCVLVDNGDQEPYLMMYNNKNNQYQDISMNDLAILKINGLETIENVSGLKKVMRKIKQN